MYGPYTLLNAPLHKNIVPPSLKVDLVFIKGIVMQRIATSIFKMMIFGLGYGTSATSVVYFVKNIWL